MNTAGHQDRGDKPALLANDPAEAPTVPPQDCPALSTSGNARGSTPSTGRVADDGTGPDPAATGSYPAAGGPTLQIRVIGRIDS
jgi:hypothetical protein